MIRFDILKSSEELDQVRKEWQLAAAMPGMTMFQRFSWNRLAAEIFGEREKPQVVVARRDRDFAILPLVLRANGMMSLLGETLFDYRDMLSSGAREIESAAIGFAAQMGNPLEITALTPAALERWEKLPTVEFCRAPRIERERCSANDLRATHRRLGNRSRRILSRGAELRQRSGSDRDLIREIYQRKAQQAGSLFADPLRREFMERIAGEEGCEVFTYEKGSDVVAAIVTFRDAGTRHCYTIYYDVDWAEMSPGQMLLYEVACKTLEEGLDCDLMTGEYPYKNRLANASVPLSRVHISAEQWRDAMLEAERAA